MDCNLDAVIIYSEKIKKDTAGGLGSIFTNFVGNEVNLKSLYFRLARR